jgi:hypothetical protein
LISPLLALRDRPWSYGHEHLHPLLNGRIPPKVELRMTFEATPKILTSLQALDFTSAGTFTATISASICSRVNPKVSLEAACFERRDRRVNRVERGSNRAQCLPCVCCFRSPGAFLPGKGDRRQAVCNWKESTQPLIRRTQFTLAFFRFSTAKFLVWEGFCG